MTLYNKIIEENIKMKKNPIIVLIEEILTELKVEFEKEYNVLTDDGSLVFDFCALRYNLMIDAASPVVGQNFYPEAFGPKSLYCVQNGVYYIVCDAADKQFLKKKIKAWIAYIKNPEKNSVPVEKELESNNE